MAEFLERQRILVLAPIGRDAQAAAQHLIDSNLQAVICTDVNDLHTKLREGAALALVTEEAFFGVEHRLWNDGSHLNLLGPTFHSLY
jgi:hypothetical protein